MVIKIQLKRDICTLLNRQYLEENLREPFHRGRFIHIENVYDREYIYLLVYLGEDGEPIARGRGGGAKTGAEDEAQPKEAQEHYIQHII